jgi:hypothetical protein
MAFLRRRPSSRNRFSYQVLESYWRNGKPRQRVLLNLGPCSTLRQAIEDARCRQAHHRLAQLLGFQRLYPGIG